MVIRDLAKVEPGVRFPLPAHAGNVKEIAQKNGFKWPFFITLEGLTFQYGYAIMYVQSEYG